MLHLLNFPWEAALYREKVAATWEVTGYVPFTCRVYWNLIRKENQMVETITTATGKINLSYQALMTLIAASGGNTEAFLPDHMGMKGVFQDNNQ